MRRDWKSLCAALAGAAMLLLLAAPVSAQLFGGDDVARKQIAEQGKRLEQQRLQNEELAARLTRMEESVRGLAGSNSTLELAQSLERLRQELTQLRGQIEVLGNDIQMAGKRQRDMYVDLDTRLKRFEQQAAEAPAPAQPGAAAAVTPGAAAPVAADTAAATPAPASEREARVYEAAQAQRKAGNYQGAIAGFRNFIAEFPKSALNHRAQYWIGDSYYNLRDFKNAIASQQRLITAYPDSASVPDALLNIASSQVELGDAPGARRTLDKLVARYPASDAAEKAKRRLAALK